MLVSAVVFCVLISSTAAVQFCYPEILYEYANDFTATQGSGEVIINPEGSVTSTDGVAMFDAQGTVEYYHMCANDWRGHNMLSFKFHPNDTSQGEKVGIMTNTKRHHVESFKISWCGDEVMLEVMLETWNTTSLKYQIRKEQLTISGLDMNETQSVRVCVEPDQIRFQSSPLIGGGAPVPVSLSIASDEELKIVGWEPMTFGTGTKDSFSGMIDEFAYYNCVPLDAFEPYDEPTTEQTTDKPTTEVTDA